MKCNPEFGTFSVRIVAWGFALLLAVFSAPSLLTDRLWPRYGTYCRRLLLPFLPGKRNVLGCGMRPA